MLPLAVYIHWPFCASKCPYCDFNSHVRESVDHHAWKNALLQELSHYQFLRPTHKVVSIFFGGGTPSLMQPGTVAALIAKVTEDFKTEDNIEITLEANPTSVEAHKLKEFRDAGVNRVSLGVQALSDDSLKFLGRKHSAGEALKAVEMAGTLFPRMSFDLIYARPGQSIGGWERELREALPFAKGHMSLYQLTIEENTPFHLHHEQGRFRIPEEELAADMYECTQAVMEEYGLPMYEISNHAASGQESRHNLAYWRGEDYIGIGPGAHGRYTHEGLRLATNTLKLPEKWLAQVQAKEQGIDRAELLDAPMQLAEKILMGLRLKGGIRMEQFARAQERLQPYVLQGLITQNGDHVSATPSGMLVLNRLTAELINVISGTIPEPDLSS